MLKKSRMFLMNITNSVVLYFFKDSFINGSRICAKIIAITQSEGLCY